MVLICIIVTLNDDGLLIYDKAVNTTTKLLIADAKSRDLSKDFYIPDLSNIWLSLVAHASICYCNEIINV